MTTTRTGTAAPPSEEQVLCAFVELADTLADPFDSRAFLERLTRHVVDLLDLEAAGAVLAGAHGQLSAVACQEPVQELELSGVVWDESPCRDAFHLGTALSDRRLDTMASLRRWPRFAPAATSLGLRRAAAVPLRLREQVLGSLTLYHNRSGGLLPLQLLLARALADTAAIGLLQRRAVGEQAEIAANLEHGLRSRIVIEQAKGALTVRRGISADAAFQLMRTHARSRRQQLQDLARQVVDGVADPGLLSPAE